MNRIFSGEGKGGKTVSLKLRGYLESIARHGKEREGMKPCRTAGGQSLKAKSDLDSLWQEALKSRLHGLQCGRQG